nr:DNA recombination protein RmuC [Desulfobulbus alkaliphilus]
MERLREDNQRLEEEILRLRQERNQLFSEVRKTEVDSASLRSTCQALRDQVTEREQLLAETRRQIEQNFQVLAGNILVEKGEQLHREHQANLSLLLQPFRTQLLDFKNRVENIHDRDTRDRVALRTEIEQLKQLNQQVSTDATNLADALRGKAKIQGLWGEMVLTRLLEASGLRNGREFAVQVSLKSEEGVTFQPDALIFLPENRTIIIDAKVSLHAFVQVHNAIDDPKRQQGVQMHLASIRKHINQLAGKQYHHLIGPGSLEFVLLFIPIEGAFQLAVQQDADILTSAMQKKIILSSPSTLLAILKTIHHLWRMDEQNRNSLIIAKQAGSLYDKFVGFVEALEDIGFRLNQSQQAWHTARNRLTTGQGNLIARTEALKHLGVQASKELPASLKHSSATQEDTP